MQDGRSLVVSGRNSSWELPGRNQWILWRITNTDAAEKKLSGLNLNRKHWAVLFLSLVHVRTRCTITSAVLQTLKTLKNTTEDFRAQNSHFKGTEELLSRVFSTCSSDLILGLSLIEFQELFDDRHHPPPADWGRRSRRMEWFGLDGCSWNTNPE